MTSWCVPIIQVVIFPPGFCAITIGPVTAVIYFEKTPSSFFLPGLCWLWIHSPRSCLNRNSPQELSKFGVRKWIVPLRSWFIPSCHSQDWIAMKEQGPWRVNRGIKDRSHFTKNPFASPPCIDYSSLSRTSRGSSGPMPAKKELLRMQYLQYGMKCSLTSF
jgi:hypothetical protein